MVDKHRKRDTPLLVIREMQIKITYHKKTYHFRHTTMVKKRQTISINEHKKKSEPSDTASENAKW